jgi:hypothetical protein
MNVLEELKQKADEGQTMALVSSPRNLTRTEEILNEVENDGEWSFVNFTTVPVGPYSGGVDLLLVFRKVNR